MTPKPKLSELVGGGAVQAAPRPWVRRVGRILGCVKGKRVRLTHIDGKLPNLALMRLSAWLKANGANVHFTKSVTRELFEQEPYDAVIGSSIFEWSENARASFLQSFPGAVVGGTGVNDPTTVEEFLGMPANEVDYTIYPHFSASIGFTQRGCRLKCPFCVVPQKEGKIRSELSVYDIWRGAPHPKRVVLLDNDFFGQEKWRERVGELKDGGFEVSLNQGINVRLIHKEGAEALATLKYRDDQFKTKRIYTAWDNRKDEAVFLRGVNLLLDAGIPPQNIMVYMLCGYWPGETWGDIMHRFETMRKIGLRPYPMVYDNKNRTLKLFQCWVIQRAYEFIPWEEYKPGAQTRTKAVEAQEVLAL